MDELLRSRPKYSRKDLGEALKAIRGWLGATQGEFAKSAGVSNTAISNYETNGVRWDKALEVLANALDISAGELEAALEAESLKTWLDAWQRARLETTLDDLRPELPTTQPFPHLKRGPTGDYTLPRVVKLDRPPDDDESEKAEFIRYRMDDDPDVVFFATPADQPGWVICGRANRPVFYDEKRIRRVLPIVRQPRRGMSPEDLGPWPPP